MVDGLLTGPISLQKKRTEAKNVNDFSETAAL